MYSCYSFFFYGYGAHRDLHSFPTRRSSDLVHHAHRGGLAVQERRLDGRHRRERGDPLRERHPHERVTTDRKSTRLNSSHVSISYAVFCLKKKKKTNIN